MNTSLNSSPAAQAASTTSGTGDDAIPVDARRMRRNLLPRMHAPMRTFMVAVMLMVYLAALAASAVLLTRLAVMEWTAGVVSEATAQVLPGDNESSAETEARANRVATWLRRQPGVAAVHVLGARESRRLLEPWLGRAGLSLDLPVPVLLAVTLDRKHPAELKRLRAGLKEAGFRRVTLDGHGRWVRELADLARTAFWLGLGVLVLLVVSLVVLVVHAARAALQANREVIEVLQLIGANDRFIARQVEFHFLRNAFLAAVAGAALAWLSLLALALLAPSAELGDHIRRLLFFAGEQTLTLYLLWAAIMVVSTLLSVTTARISTVRILSEMFR